MNWKLSVGIVAVVILGGVGVWWLSSQPKPPVTPDQIIQEAKNTPIPVGARAIDAFAFVDESGVYLKSSFSTSTVKIPDADPETFRSVMPFTEYSDQAVLDFCKGPGTYSVYADKKKTYFFQFWMTPTFSKTKIEVIKALNSDAVAPTGAHSFTDGVATLKLGYAFATTTCEFILEPATGS